MFQVLKQIFSGKKSPDHHPYYGSFLTVKSKSIDFFQHTNHNSEIQKSNIDYIVIHKGEDYCNLERCWIDLKSFSSAAISINTLSGNFDYLEKWLFTLPDFNKQKYLEIRNTNAELKTQVLWEKKSVSDFDIKMVTEKSNISIKNGIYLENLKTTIPWETYIELEKNKILIRKKLDFPNPDFLGYSYSINNPTIFGGIKLSNLYTECDAFEKNPRLDLPVIKYISEIKLGFYNTEKEFLKIKKHLDHYFNQDGFQDYGENYPIRKNEDIKAFWAVDKVLISMCCFYREENQKLDTNAWLNIKFSPNIDRFFESDYQKNLQLHKHLEYEIFPFEVDLNINYREMNNVIFTPKCFAGLFENENQFLIWNDRQEGVIGFATAKYARLFKINTFKSVGLGKDDFGASEGWNQISVDAIYLGNLSSFKSKVFEDNISKMQKLTNKEFFSFQEDPNRWR